MDDGRPGRVWDPANHVWLPPSPKAKGLLQPFEYRPASSIPARQWLYGRHYVRQYISTTVAPAGLGKSALALAEALAMSSARPLLGLHPAERLRVGYWNGEDPLEETERRIAAAILHHDLSGPDLEGWLFWGSGRESELMLAQQTRDGVIINEPDVARVKAAIAEGRLDALIIDPFVRSHGVTENDNGAIDKVARTWAEIADVTNIAIELIHHTRKSSGGQETTVEDGRGAVALLASARSARVLNVMSEEQASQAGVERRRSYFRVENGKANMAPPPEESDWYRFVSVDLENGESGLGDNVGVVVAWDWPNPFDGVSTHDVQRVQQEVDAGSYRENIQARDWVGHAVARVLKLDLDDKHAKAKVKSLIRTWIKNDVLTVEMRPDHRRELRPFVVAGKPVEP